MSEEKSQAEMLKESLSYEVKNAWEQSDDSQIRKAFDLCENYKVYLDKGKTEREFSSLVEKELIKAGYHNLQELFKERKKLNKGDKVYYVNKKKSVAFAVIGQKPLTEGINMVGAHIDSPRIDIKQNPLYEDSGLVLLKTHYYGCIKK